MKRADIFEAIDAERARQDRKFPLQWAAFAEAMRVDRALNGRGRVAQFECNAILGEESGEVAKAVLERDVDGLRAELVQVAAVAVAWLEALPV